MIINFYLLRTFCPHLGSFFFCFFFHHVSAKFHLCPSSGDLPRPRIGMLAGLGRIWNRYLLTMLIWNRRDSTPLSAALRAPRFTWSKTWCDWQQLWKAVINGDTVTRLSILIRGRGKSPEEGQMWNLAET